MHVGVIADWTEPAFFITPKARKLLKLGAGDYLDVKSEEQDTQVTRKLADIQSISFSSNSYLYMDPYSLRLLSVDLHAAVVVSPSAETLELP